MVNADVRKIATHIRTFIRYVAASAAADPSVITTTITTVVTTTATSTTTTTINHHQHHQSASLISPSPPALPSNLPPTLPFYIRIHSPHEEVELTLSM